MTDIDDTPGVRVRHLRERRGQSRAALAGLLGKTEDWLKKIENGKRNLPLEQGIRLARTLGAGDLSEVYGPDVSVPVHTAERPSHPAAEQVGHALTGYLPSLQEEPPSVTWLESAVAAAWREWHTATAQRSTTAETLPALIRAGRAAVREHQDAERRRARAALGDVMHLGQAFLAWQGDAHHWYWLSVDRGQQLAEDADDPQSYATGMLYSALALRVTGREQQALDLLRLATDALEPWLDDGGDEVRGLWGVLQLNRASTTARHVLDHSAWQHWQAAERMLDRMPAGYAHHHGYSSGHVALHRTWIAQALGDSAEAVRQADSVDLDAIPSRAWKVSHLVYVAKALHQQHDSGALIPLMQAETYSHEAVRFNIGAREVIADLAKSGPSSVRTEAARFSDRLGLAA